MVHEKTFIGGKALVQPAFKTLTYDAGVVVQNQWYTAFTGRNVVFNGLGIKVTVANETVDIRITIDGVLYSSSGGVALTFGANPWTIVEGFDLTTGALRINPSASGAGASFTPDYNTAFWLKGRSVKIEVRKTTAGGASHLLVYGQYHED